VPNFAGGSLPRCDSGDREYYCVTMLTLFKPWRHGKNLKEDDQSWDEAFTNYKFNPHQTEPMKFFNICYEWNDARDDYSKLLKQQNATRMVSFLTGSVLMTMVTLVIPMMVVTL
jgi:hypothetical protein